MYITGVHSTTENSPPSEPLIRTPCLSESSRWIASDRGSADPGPGPYGAPSGHFRESEPVVWPDWGWAGTGKMGFGEGWIWEGFTAGEMGRMGGG
jgi:hypothetical protein